MTVFYNWCGTQQQDFYNIGHSEHHSSPGQIPLPPQSVTEWTHWLLLSPYMVWHFWTPNRQKIWMLKSEWCYKFHSPSLKQRGSFIYSGTNSLSISDQLGQCLTSQSFSKHTCTDKQQNDILSSQMFLCCSFIFYLPMFYLSWFIALEIIVFIAFLLLYFSMFCYLCIYIVCYCVLWSTL